MVGGLHPGDLGGDLGGELGVLEVLEDGDCWRGGDHRIFIIVLTTSPHTNRILQY